MIDRIEVFYGKISLGDKMRILQISDIHAQINNFQTKRLRHSFMKKITDLHTENNYDYIFLSGDISHQGQAFNENTKKLIEDLMNTLELDTNKLIIIPGNHDLVRNSDRSELIEKIKAHENPSDYLDETLMVSAQKEILLSSFKEFEKFYELIKNEQYPQNELHHLIELEKFNLILCNTNIICNHAGEEGSLLIAKIELFECLQKISSPEKPTIAMGHHTLDCLTLVEKNEVLTMFDDFNVKLYLSGHVHKAHYKLEADHYNEVLMIVCSGLHFDGYTQSGFVDILIDESTYYITQYIWNSEHKYWTTNNNLGRKMIDGKLIHQYNKSITFSHTNIETVKKELVALFNENERIWKQYGPQSLIALSNPISDLHKTWKLKCIEEIIPNNEKILSIILENIEMVPKEKRDILELYKTHVEGFKNNHLSSYPSQDVPTFPTSIKNIFD
ncbi:metallophosphoesterase [Peribacillus cavernae]|uniref:Metallophosphoesterase n=1 Tax=Peribacillus cavernae TaxID=1674310 RepID=A0A433H865_9BACI|nr:metallophosphoesterase [Peribacillus cavernae]MDQ0220975.1 3',5'-cyclic AMP phosphodiesterase CpdA [Peribacillus cavernae]RUQ24500.1 metallophosphoesterase [Peribacillus cavernae]